MRFRVIDTGIGVPADAMGKLFQPFQQVEATRGKRLGGSKRSDGLTIWPRDTSSRSTVIWNRCVIASMPIWRPSLAPRRIMLCYRATTPELKIATSSSL